MVNYEKYDPCPECGAENNLQQEIRQTENVRTDENGIPEEFSPEGLEIEKLICKECDTRFI